MKNAAIKIVENLAQLVKVKTLVTLVLTAVFAVLAVRGSINPEQFLTVFTVVVSFYFGTQYERKSIGTGEAQQDNVKVTNSN